jgi:hypothetical protein
MSFSELQQNKSMGFKTFRKTLRSLGSSKVSRWKKQWRDKSRTKESRLAKFQTSVTLLQWIKSKRRKRTRTLQARIGIGGGARWSLTNKTHRPNLINKLMKQSWLRSYCGRLKRNSKRRTFSRDRTNANNMTLKWGGGRRRPCRTNEKHRTKLMRRLNNSRRTVLSKSGKGRTMWGGSKTQRLRERKSWRSDSLTLRSLRGFLIWSWI